MQHIKRMASIVLILALLISVLPLDSIVWATSAETTEPVTEAAAETPAEAATTEAPTEPEPAPEPTGTETTAVTAEPAPEPATEGVHEAATEAATEPAEAPLPSEAPAKPEEAEPAASGPENDAPLQRRTDAGSQLPGLLPVPAAEGLHTDEMGRQFYVIPNGTKGQVQIFEGFYSGIYFNGYGKYGNFMWMATDYLAGSSSYYTPGEWVYCIDYDHSSSTGGTTTYEDLNQAPTWAALSSEKKLGITLALSYGAQSDSHNNFLSQVATQTIIWEYQRGGRTNASTYTSNSQSPISYASNGNGSYTESGYKTQINNEYSRILNAIKNAEARPSFTETTFTFNGTGSSYAHDFTDQNGALSKGVWMVSSCPSELKASIVNGKLRVYPTSSFTGTKTVVLKRSLHRPSSQVYVCKAGSQWAICGVPEDTDQVTVTVSVQQPTVSLKKTTEGSADVLKCIENNPLYTLRGAVYEIHKGSPTGEITETLTTNVSGEANGTKQYAVGTKLYAVEKTAPSGYLLNTTPVELTVAASGNVFNVEDTPTFDPIKLKIKKTDSDGTKIAGAVFKAEFYADTWANGDRLLRTWYLKSDADGQVKFDDAHLLSSYEGESSSALYKPNGEFRFPLGCVVVTEIKTASGYVLPTSGNSVCIFIRQGGGKTSVNGAAAGAYWGDASANPLDSAHPKGIYRVENDADKTTLTAVNKPAYGKPFDVKKIDPNDSALEGAVFKVVYYADSWCNPDALKKTWYFKTDNNGYFTLEAKYLASGYESSSLYEADKIPLGLMVVSEEKAPNGFQKALFNGVWRIRQKEAGSPDVESYWAESNGYTPTDNYGSNVYILEEEPDTLYVKNKPIPGTGAMFKTVDAGAPEGYTPELPSPEGYSFNLFRAKDQVSGKKTWYGKSDADGKVYLTDKEHSTVAPGDRDYTFTGLYDGTYVIRELIASSGITDDLWPSQIEITTSGGTTAACHYVIPDAANGLILANKDGDCVVSNLKLTGLNGGGSLTIKIKNQFTPPPTPAKGSLKLVKYEKGTQKPLKNAGFRLFDYEENQIAEKYTDANGEILFEDLNADVEYFYQEFQAPEGYELDDTMYSFSLSEENLNIVKIAENTPEKGSLKVVKQSDDGNVANITFTIKDGDTIIYTGKTNRSGVLNVKNKLTIGKTYTVVETVPENYVSDNRTQTFVAQSGTNVLTFVNHPIVKLKVIKQSDDGNVANIQFTVKDGDEVIWEGVTEDNGELLIEDLLTLGKTYTVIETVPENYVSEKRVQKFTAKIGLNVLTFVNHPVVKLKVVKQSDDGNVANIAFTVKDGDEVIWQGVTEDNGELLIEDLLTLGKTYTVIETVPKNYVSEKREQTFVAELGTTTLTFINHPVVKLKVVKHSDDGNIENIHFTVKDGDTVVWKGKTDENGELLVEDVLTLGTVYTVIETVPAHYLSEKRVQTFTAKLGTTTLTFINHPLGRAKMFKTVDTGIAEGFRFKLERTGSDQVWYGVSAKDGIVYVSDANWNVSDETVFEDFREADYVFTEMNSDVRYALDHVAFSISNEDGTETATVRVEASDFTEDEDGNYASPVIHLGMYGKMLIVEATNVVGQMHTTAVWQNGEKTVFDNETVTVHEKAVITKVRTGSYVMVTSLMDKSSKKVFMQKTSDPFLLDYNEQNVFETEFDLRDQKKIPDEMVVFERLYRADDTALSSPVLIHEDWDDKGQTVNVAHVTLHTTAENKADGKKYLLPIDGETIRDHVLICISNLPAENEVYELTGMAMAVTTDENGKLVGTPVLGKDGKPLTVSASFIGVEGEQSVDMDFSVAGTTLNGATVVIVEKLIRSSNGKEIASHNDLSDKDQTVFFTSPFLHTTATNAEDGEKLVLPLERVQLKDVVELGGLPKDHYTLTGQLMTPVLDKDGNPVLDEAGNPKAAPILIAGNPIIVTKSIDGGLKPFTVNMEATVDGRTLKGKTVVWFETLTRDRDRVEVSCHKDITDVGQSVFFADISIRTKASSEDNKPVVDPLGKVTILDTVFYTGLVPGKEYTINGILMVKETGMPLLENGEPVTASILFTPDARDGSVELSFTFCASTLRGESLVVFEALYYGKEELITHSDINDKDQTVEVKNPVIRTSASNLDDGEKLIDPLTEISLEDVVSFENLIPGHEYTLKGVLMERIVDEEGKVTESVFLTDGEPVTTECSFVPDTENGSVSLVFTFAGLNLRGNTLVAFESLYSTIQPDEAIAEHRDIEDKDQTVEVTDISIRTKARIGEDGGKITDPLEKVTIIDEVSYTGLIVGKAYTIYGVLVVKDTGMPLLDEHGKPVSADVEFVAEQPDGSIELSFAFNATLLRGETLVAFETLRRDGIELAVHANLDDEDQTVRIGNPEIKTTASDENGAKLYEIDNEILVIDTVEYAGLIPGHAYMLVGSVMDADEETELLVNDKSVVATLIFTPDAAEGTVSVTFTFDGLSLMGKHLVVFETLYRVFDDDDAGENTEWLVDHRDFADLGQTVEFTTPEISTTATNAEDGSHVAEPLDTVTIVDRVTFKNLIPGKTYTVNGILMDKAVNEPLMIDGKEVTASAEFTPTEAEGYVDIEFTFCGLGLNGRSLVAFETLSRDGIELAVHADIDDTEQTVTFTKPEISTTATVNGGKQATVAKRITLIDAVAYQGLVPGKEYVLKGILMDKATNKPLLIDGKEVTAEAKLIPTSEKGVTEMEFVFDASSLGNKEIVVFEALYCGDTLGDTLIAEHADIQDKGQTVSFVPDTPKIPKTGDDGTVGRLLWGGGLFVSGLTLLVELLRKRRRRNTAE